MRLCSANVADGWPAHASARLRSPPLQAAFHYPDAAAWRSQMVDRPHPVQALRVGTTCRALIECVGETDRLQWLDGEPRERVAAIRAIAAYAHRRKRRFFMYSTRPGEAAVARRLGLVTRPGYMRPRIAARDHSDRRAHRGVAGARNATVLGPLMARAVPSSCNW